jgi:uncharacterized protein YndB with AHSA1/START domain
MFALAAVAKPGLVLERRIKASPEKIFAAWTDPAQLIRWFGPDGGGVETAETDLRVGGRYRIVFRTEDGEEHHFGGVYREVVADRRLVFTWAWRSTPERESLVTVTVAPEGDGSRLTLLHEQFFDDAARDRHAYGWTGSLAKLERLFV